jgi:predicted chitinase
MPATVPPQFASPTSYDRTVFASEFAEQFSHSHRYNAGALHDTFALLRMIEQDRDITDLRWAAYMFATTMWETTSPHRIMRPAHNRKGKILKDKHGKIVMVKTIRWLFTMAPVDEVGHGKGRRYHEPVKVSMLSDGSARITEHDGDQFLVHSNGAIDPVTSGAKIGAKDGAHAAKRYDEDTGVEQVYYGRGYVQLTWWSNYATTGVALGRGLDLLKDPELVKKPEIAFEIMAHGMLTGEGFANGNKLADFIAGDDCDYEGARGMVNGSDHAEAIAELAKKMQAVLMKSRSDPRAKAPTRKGPP